ncbi:hypothetical protein B0H63DRAFT_520550 [Podospora didyma]|uniref:Uncharacterized protein n=1 Tax=Podospora didyma TaxID=330526 RepID=A0AAE0U0V2_9PEZI|nr:hypothetical protein B0H63DRAFT_520550 [Podospora didyma]
MDRRTPRIAFPWLPAGPPNKRTLGEFHDLTLASEYKLGVAKREYGDLKEARQRFRSVFVKRANLLGKSHPDSLTAKREFVITSCALSQWENPDTKREDSRSLGRPSLFTQQSSSSRGTSADLDYRSTLGRKSTISSFLSDSDNWAAQGPVDETSAEDGQEMTLDDWTSVEQCSHNIAAEQESRIGTEHPETLDTLLSIFAVQLLVGKIREASQTMDTLLERLRRPRVQEQRLLHALQMEQKIAMICLDQNQVADGIGILSHIIHRGQQYMGDAATEPAHPELTALVNHCEEQIIAERENAESTVGRILEVYHSTAENETRQADANIYLANAVKLAIWALGSEHRKTQIAKAKSVQRYKKLVSEVEGLLRRRDLESTAEILSQGYMLLEAMFPDRDVEELRSNLEKVLDGEEQRVRTIMEAEQTKQEVEVDNGVAEGIVSNGVGDDVVSKVVETLLKFIEVENSEGM